MITKITTVEELKQIFTEILLNKTDKISDVANESVLNAISYGCSKLAQRLLVNQAIVEAHIFPDTAHGEYLDKIAELRGISARNGSLGSTVFLRIEGEPGSVYNKDDITFVSSSGIHFKLENDFELDGNGWGYVKVKSLETGLTSNVDALTINTIQ